MEYSEDIELRPLSRGPSGLQALQGLQREEPKRGITVASSGTFILQSLAIEEPKLEGRLFVRKFFIFCGRTKNF